MTQRCSKAIFPGTFNPFTIGHKDIADRALKLFGHLTIVIGVNIAKNPGEDPQQRARDIRAYFPADAPVDVVICTGLIIDAARQCRADAIVKGARNVRDFEYERDMADLNRQLSGIETVILYSDPRYSAISSSAVRELAAFGKDITPYLPPKLQ